MINKNTQLCISMAKKAGNFGCSIHNAAFKKMNLNFIYKSFSVEEGTLEQAVDGIRALGIRGAGITMPHKINVLEYVDDVSQEVSVIGAANTLVNDEGRLKAYNTDAYSAYTVLSRYTGCGVVHILGNGGYSKAVQYASKQHHYDINVITRENWHTISDIKEGVIFNCTPVKDITVNKNASFINCLINTESGQELSLLQASKQFKLYTGIEFPLGYIKKHFQQILEENNPEKR